MQLNDLWHGDLTFVTTSAASYDQRIEGLTCDSRQVEPGFLFAALPGSKVDGRAFIGDALARGAVAILAPEGTDPHLTSDAVRLYTAANPRRHYALAAAQFYGKQPNRLTAITGTNGKTSVAGFVRQILSGLGHKSASAGTLGIELGGFAPAAMPNVQSPYGLTTPDSVDLHKSLAELASFGIDHMAIEASSHGLDQYRLDGIKFSAAAFTNLTRDHLDYHGTVESYLEAKLRLFSELVVDGGSAVINADDPYANAFRSVSQGRGLQLLTYGLSGQDIELLGLAPLADGQRLSMRVYGTPYEIELPLVGAFQAANALCALGLVVTLGENVANAVGQLETLSGITGRLERVARTRGNAPVFVDYAHTPDALSAALQALRPHTEKRLHVVFGCGGDRDPGKRPEMGAVACRDADVVVITDDNPRNEDPATIRAAARAACPDAAEIADRRDAIDLAIKGLMPGDTLLVAGKGHETGQIVGDQVIPFNDRETIWSLVSGGDL